MRPYFPLLISYDQITELIREEGKTVNVITERILGRRKTVIAITELILGTKNPVR